MTPKAAARRAQWTREGSWTRQRVQATLQIAWAARPRTTEHTSIMMWPTLHLPGTDPEHGHIRMAIHMMGLKAQYPDLSIVHLANHRLNCAFSTYRARVKKGCEEIAMHLNEGREPIVIYATPKQEAA